jgi:hypothetical protein
MKKLLGLAAIELAITMPMFNSRGEKVLFAYITMH